VPLGDALVMQPIDRRTFLADLGRGAFALAVVSIAACSPAAQVTARPSASAPRSTPGASEPPTSANPSDAPPSSAPSSGDGFAWERVDLGFVSAYILVRGGEAAIVDTGVGGSAGAIETSLAGIGIDWSAVGHLILTHRHGDHIGCATDVLERAPEAVGYAGAEDVSGISVPRPLIPVEDGDRIFDLQIVTAPGHTPGSICVFDPAGGILVAGDALRTEGGRPGLPRADFTESMDEARRSVAKLGGLTFETLLVGHGDPIESGASAAVAELAAQSG
jgi:glyoxylase-like metal-dependent hydrolase (beta-lactamase superfamily II)